VRDAYGGILNIVFIALFLIIVEGILGLVVNYTKAFKMKNSVISTIEQYEASGCFDEAGDTACIDIIKDRAKNIGYSPVSLKCPDGYDKIQGLFCYKSERVTTNDKLFGSPRMTYRVVTQVDINIPIINKIMGLSFFQVSGDTKIIELQS